MFHFCRKESTQNVFLTWEIEFFGTYDRKDQKRKIVSHIQRPKHFRLFQRCLLFGLCQCMSHIPNPVSHRCNLHQANEKLRKVLIEMIHCTISTEELIGQKINATSKQTTNQRSSNANKDAQESGVWMLVTVHDDRRSFFTWKVEMLTLSWCFRFRGAGADPPALWESAGFRVSHQSWGRRSSSECLQQTASHCGHTPGAAQPGQHSGTGGNTHLTHSSQLLRGVWLQTSTSTVTDTTHLIWLLQKASDQCKLNS